MEHSVNEDVLNIAVANVLASLQGVNNLYDSQLSTLKLLLEGKNVFLTSPTNSGKSLPPLILPSICLELTKLGFRYPASPRVLFITALNSIQHSLLSSSIQLNISCAAVTSDNVTEVLNSEASVLFVGPEVLKTIKVTKALLQQRDSFVCKVIDEVHLGK